MNSVKPKKKCVRPLKSFDLNGMIGDTLETVQELLESDISDTDLEYCFSKDYLSLYFEFYRLRDSILNFLSLYKKGNN